MKIIIDNKIVYNNSDSRALIRELNGIAKTDITITQFRNDTLRAKKIVVERNNDRKELLINDRSRKVLRVINRNEMAQKKLAEILS